MNILNSFSLYKRINNSPKAKELFKNSLWSTIGAILSKGLLFISWIFVARILGAEGYGQFGIVRSTVLMFTAFAGFSLGITASKHVAEFSEIDKEKTARILGLTILFGLLMGVIVGSIFFLLSPWLATETLNAPEIVNELRIGALILFFSAVNGSQIGALQGFMAFKRIAKINIIQSIICVPLFILGAIYLGVNGTVWAFAISYIVICFLSYFAINKEAINHKLKINYSEAWQERKLLFSYSLPAFLGGLMVTPIKWYTDSLLVSQAGFSEMGIFTATLTFNSILLVGAGMLSAPFLSIMARNKEEDRNSNFSRFNIIFPWAIGVFVASPFIVFPEFMSVIFGSTYAGKNFELTFITVLLFTIIIMFKQGLARIMAVYDLQWWSFFSNFIWGIVLIGAFVFFRDKNSFYLALSYLIAYFINVIIVMPIYFKKKLIPSKTIMSYESLGIWTITIIMAIIGATMTSIVFKLTLYLILFSLLAVFFISMYKKK